MRDGEKPSDCGGLHAGVRAAWMIALALSLALMHGLGLSHTAPTIDTAAMSTTTGAPSDASGLMAAHGQHDATVLVADQGGHQNPSPDHSGAVAKTCLAVLTALLVAFTMFLLTPQGRTRYRRDRPASSTPRVCNRAMWWVHPRAHVLCVMRT